jgi:hypothetical protein
MKQSSIARRSRQATPPVPTEITVGGFARVTATIPAETGFRSDSLTVLAMCPGGNPIDFQVVDIKGAKVFLAVPNPDKPNGVESLPLEVPAAILMASPAARQHFAIAS